MPFDRSKYSDDWEKISWRIRFERAQRQCEWHEDGVRCEARHNQRHPVTGSMVRLTTAHLNHDTTDNSDSNLMAMCQLHHNRFDMPMRQRNAAATRRRKREEAGQLPLL